MFGFLKDKLSKAVKSIADRLTEKDDKKEAMEKEVEKKVETAVEKSVAESKTPEGLTEEKIEDLVEKDVRKAVEKEIGNVVQEPALPAIAVKEPPKFELPTKHLPEPTPELTERIQTSQLSKTGPTIERVEKKAGIETDEPIAVFPEKRSLIKRIFEKVTKTIVERKLTEAELGPVLNDLEADLIEADVALEVAEKIKKDLLRDLTGKDIKRGGEKDAIVDAFKESIRSVLDVPTVDLKQLATTKKPVVLLFLGFNGSGKTTSIAKMANWLKGEGYSCVFAAADSWRAAAIEQIEEHGGKIGVKVIKHNYGADPAAIVFDAIEHAKAKGINFVLADSAGRTYTNQNLMAELGKIVRVNKPDLNILVIDSMTGNDAVMQAKEFGTIGVDAVIFTKVDVNEKGGAILSVTNELKKPILFLGVGQEYGDFEKFDAEKFISRIF
jgi:fused signal recognition particle receptor